MPSKQRLSNGLLIKDMPWKSSWKGAKNRCLPKGDYHKRGIKFLLTPDEMQELWDVCEADKLKRHSLDRINTKGHYEFSNCQFIELSVNSSKDSRKKNKVSTINKISKSSLIARGKNLTTAQVESLISKGCSIRKIAKIVGVSVPTVYYRLSNEVK